MQSVEAGFNGSVGFGKRVSLIVPRVGDLMSKVYLQAILPELTELGGGNISWINEVGHFLIQSIEVQIGGQIIDKHYGTWLSLWAYLTLPTGKLGGYGEMIGDDLAGAAVLIPETEIYVPLQFWFCQHEGLALPLIALQYHEVRFVLQFETLANLLTEGTPAANVQLDQAQLYIDYIFLDTDERRKFAQTSHEYLCSQLAFTGNESLNTGTTGVKLNFNHPVKELVWVILSTERPMWPYHGATDTNPVARAKLAFNGHDRFSERTGKYFNLIQPYQHHTNIPTDSGINVYSFALYPELEQPSGTSNFSRIDNSTLSITLNSDIVAAENDLFAKIYAVNYNVLRIMSGYFPIAIVQYKKFVLVN